mmetsp:Transcript_28537/g.72252  ORF Transcript_28537/g.72252 Transcript_28537/m.72252 type:complete len:435 (+) Transcript_28537:76-1380(+)
MGSTISGPIAALATCLGSCVGGCIAKGCCALAGSGNVNNAYAARCVMLWLQAFTAIVAWLTSATASRWLPGPCAQLPSDLGDLGVCECHSERDPTVCWKNQMVYRTEASLVVVLLGLLLMSVSGCAPGAARAHSVAKFMLVLLVILVALFIPNSWFTVFGTVATSASAIFLAAQSIFVMDFGYGWAELWLSKALAAQRREIGQRGKTLWLVAILVSAGLLAVGALVLCVFLYSTTPVASGRIVNLTAMIISWALLVVSVLDWCEHGSILCSTVVMLYTMWLVYESMSVLPDGLGPQCPMWIGLAICGFSLVAFALGVGRSGASPDQAARLVDAEQGGAATTEMREGGAREEEDATAPAPADSGRDADAEDSRQMKGFSLQCAVHAAAALYITASMAPQAGQFTFVSHVVAVFAALFFYGWSLIAPKVLTSRDFS